MFRKCETGYAGKRMLQLSVLRLYFIVVMLNIVPLCSSFKSISRMRVLGRYFSDKSSSLKPHKKLILSSTLTGSELLSDSVLSDVRLARLDKMKQFRNMGTNPFAYSYTQTHKANELKLQFAHLLDGTEDITSEVAVAGRIMIRRVFGKLAFFQLQDDSGTIQLYIEKGRLMDEFNNIKDLTDAGDIIGAKGTMKRTDKVGYN